MNCAGRWGRWTGIPVGIGIGPTKTLAKLANRLAKKHPDFLAAGICDLTALSESMLERYLASLEVADVWGVGPRWATRLVGLGVYTARDLSQVDPVWVRRHFNGGVDRTALELLCIACFPLEESPPAKQQIVSSRSFGQLITDLEALSQAVSTYVARVLKPNQSRYFCTRHRSTATSRNTIPASPSASTHPSVIRWR
jgi:DNA polymerase V